MAVPAAGLASVADAKAAQQVEGVIKTILAELNKSVIHVSWERDPKKHDRIRVRDIDLNLTTGIILGTAALAIVWELTQNWLAAGGGGAATSEAVTAAELVGGPAGWITIGITDLLTGQPQTNSDGSAKTVSVPGTFGAALNQMLRNVTVAGPGQLSQAAVNLVGSIVK